MQAAAGKTGLLHEDFKGTTMRTSYNDNISVLLLRSQRWGRTQTLQRRSARSRTTRTTWSGAVAGQRLAGTGMLPPGLRVRALPMPRSRSLGTAVQAFAGTQRRAGHHWQRKRGGGAVEVFTWAERDALARGAAVGADRYTSCPTPARG